MNSGGSLARGRNNGAGEARLGGTGNRKPLSRQNGGRRDTSGIEPSLWTASVTPVSGSNTAAGGNGILRWGGYWRWQFGRRRPRNRISRLFVAHFLFANSGVAEVARLAALGTNDLQFDDEVVGTTDHHQMFNIVASIITSWRCRSRSKRIDSPEPQLAGLSVARQPEPSSEGKAENHRKARSRRQGTPVPRRERRIYCCKKTFT